MSPDEPGGRRTHPPVDPDVLSNPDTTSPIPGAPLPADYADYDRFRAVFEHAPVPMTIVDVATRTSYPNRALLALLRYDLPGAPPFDAHAVTHPDDQDRSDEAFARLAMGLVDRVSVDKRYVRADGSVFVGRVDGVLLVDDDQPWAILTVVTDLTERLATAQKLAHGEARLQALVDNLSDAVLVVDADGIVTFASPSAAPLAGRTIDALVGSSPFDLVHPDDVALVLQSFLETASRPGAAPPLRFRLVRADGSLRLVEAVAVNLLDDPAVAGVVVTLRDRTDHENVETALEVSENRFRRMLENISDTVSLIAADGSVIATTGNVRETLGFPTEFWSARNGFELLVDEDRPLVRRMLEQLLATPGATVEAEFRVRDADGEPIDVEGSAVNLLDDPSVGAIVLTTRNITPRKQIERELAAARDHAVRELGIRNEFIASVSHELRTPIHGILGLSELLSTAEVDRDAAALARAIGRATASLQVVLDDLLDFAKIEAGRLELALESVALRELVEEVATLYRTQAESKGLTLRVEVEDRVPDRLQSDGFRLRQVLSNLVTNAVKFTRRGEVVVRLSLDGGPGSATDTLCLEVADDGIGIAPAVLDRIFEPFSQAYATTAREFGGTGLGLVIARRITELLGGRLTVRSEEGVGSTFRVYLPIGEAPGSPVSPLASTVAPSGAVPPGARVLVVDDNPVNQLLIRHQLERLGLEPEVVGSGREALERFRVRRPDLVLMDCQMPELDGFSTTGLLRQHERDHGGVRAPVVALTANALPGERARCLEAGMDDYLAKPVGLADLRAAVDRWIPVAATVGPGRSPTQPDEPGDMAGAVDTAVLDVLVDEVGSRSVVETVVRTFLRELPDRLAAVAAADADPAARAAAAHALRGPCATIGARPMAACCEDLEHPPAGGPTRTVQELRARADEVRAALQRWLAG